MTIQDTHDWLDFMTRKARTGFFSREQKDDALHKAQLGVFASYFAEFLQTQFIHEALRPFRKEHVGQTNAHGLLTYPADYEHATGGRITYYDNSLQQTFVSGLKIYRDDEIADALNSQVRPVTVQRPIGQLNATGLQTYPRGNIYTITLNYLSTPIKPVYAYTVSGVVDTWVPEDSVDLQWGETYVMQVMMKALEYLGVNLNSADMVQYANEKVAQTQSSPVKN